LMTRMLSAAFGKQAVEASKSDSQSDSNRRGELSGERGQNWSGKRSVRGGAARRWFYELEVARSRAESKLNLDPKKYITYILKELVPDWKWTMRILYRYT